jgi:hypothetical protein
MEDIGLVPNELIQILTLIIFPIADNILHRGKVNGTAATTATTPDSKDFLPPLAPSPS